MITIKEDRYGLIRMSGYDNLFGKSVEVFFQFESDTDAIKEYLKQDEIDDLESGYTIEINDNEPRASALSEYFGTD